MPSVFLLVALSSSVLSWLYSAFHYCRYCYGRGALNDATHNLIAPYLLASFGLRSVFSCAALAALCALVPGFLENGAYVAAFIVSMAGLSLIEKFVFGCLIGPRISGHPIGSALIQLLEGLTGLDTAQWSRVARAMDDRLFSFRDEMRDVCGRDLDDIYERHKPRVLAHLSTQRRWAYLIGGPWFTSKTRATIARHSSELSLVDQNHKWEVVAWALGVDALGEEMRRIMGDAPERKIRVFERKNHMRELGATIVIPGASPVAAEILQSSALGMRLRCSIAKDIEEKASVTVEVGDQTLECQKVWSHENKMGLRIKSDLSGSRGGGSTETQSIATPASPRS